MIKYKSINGLPVDEQGNIVECKYSLVQGDYVLVFDSYEELMNYIKPDLSFVKRAEIEQQAEELFDKSLADNWYTKFDIYLYASKGEKLAVDILAYYEYLWETIETNFNQDNYNFKLPNFEQWQNLKPIR